MTANWTTPRTWITNELVTSTIMNAHVRDNLDYLFARPQDVDNVNSAANYSTTSTSFTDVSTSELSLTLTPQTGKVLVGFTGNVYQVATAVRAYFNVAVDGVAAVADDGLLVLQVSANPALVSFVYLATGLTVASHTFRVQWKTNAGTIGMYSGAGTASFDVHPQLWALEI